MSTPGPGQPDKDPIIVDAGVAVGFAAIKSLPRLVNPLTEAQFRIMFPAVVDGEIADQERKYPGVLRRWKTLSETDRVHILEPVDVLSGDPRVLQQVANFRRVEIEDALTSRRDLGETLTIAHAVVLRSDGFDVTVAVDDADGRRLAERMDLEVATTVDILGLGIELGHYSSVGEVKELYGRLRKVSRLPAWDDTPLEAAMKDHLSAT